MTRRSQSSSRWLQEHFNDPCVRRAQGGGAWSQYALTRVGPKGRVIASDILPMDALAGLALDMAGRVLKPGGAALI